MLVIKGLKLFFLAVLAVLGLGAALSSTPEEVLHKSFYQKKCL